MNRRTFLTLLGISPVLLCKGEKGLTVARIQEIRDQMKPPPDYILCSSGPDGWTTTQTDSFARIYYWDELLGKHVQITPY